MGNFQLALVNADELLIELIESEIINGRLIYGLGTLQIDAQAYHLKLSGRVFRTLGYHEDSVPDDVSDTYFELVRRASLVVPKRPQDEPFGLAVKIVEELQQFRIRNNIGLFEN